VFTLGLRWLHWPSPAAAGKRQIEARALPLKNPDVAV